MAHIRQIDYKSAIGMSPFYTLKKTGIPRSFIYKCLTKNIGFMKLFIACRKSMHHLPAPCLQNTSELNFILNHPLAWALYLQIAKPCFEQNITTEVLYHCNDTIMQLPLKKRLRGRVVQSFTRMISWNMTHLSSVVPGRFAKRLIAIDDWKVYDLGIGKNETAVSWKKDKMKIDHFEYVIIQKPT